MSFCADEDLSSSNPEDSRSNSEHKSDTNTYYLHSDLFPIVINHGTDHKVANFLVQHAAHFIDEYPTHGQKVDKNISPLPHKNKYDGNQPYTPPRINRWTIFFTWFTPYRQLFVFMVSINLIGAAVGLSGHWTWSKRNATPLVVGNILLAIGIRSEFVLRFLYWIAVKTFRPSIFPLWLRVKVVGILYHIGEPLLTPKTFWHI
jgi:hypothetical protein